MKGAKLNDLPVGQPMKFEPNLGSGMRVLYVLAGIVLIVLSAIGPVAGTLALVVGILGGVSIVEGAVGY